MTPQHAHESAANQIEAVSCAVITVSDTRTKATDSGGRQIIDQLTEDGQTLFSYVLVPDNVDDIQRSVELYSRQAEIVILTGGTGISHRDNTYEAVHSLFDKELPGFGELFRALSYQEIGTASMLSRAVAGTYLDAVVFSIPGSVPAVRLAMERLILPAIKHLVSELRKHKP